MSSSSRDRILGRITTALKQKSLPPRYEPRPIFAPIDDLKHRFELECKNNHTECFFTRNADETQAQLLEILASLEQGLVFVEDSSFIRERLHFAPRELQWSSEGPAPENSQATITHVEALVAATGSLLVTTSCGGRRGSIVAPAHIVIARENQLVADIESALALVERNGWTQTNSFLAVITGCSRTADIEKLLVIGAHGPKRVIVIVEE